MRTLFSALPSVLLTGLLFMCLSSTAQTDKPTSTKQKNAAASVADYVFRHGAIYTIDSKRPTVDAIAVTGKKISYVGDDKGAEAWIGKKTKVIDLQGRMLLPGFVESHIHPTLAFFTGEPISNSIPLKR